MATDRLKALLDAKRKATETNDQIIESASEFLFGANDSSGEHPKEFFKERALLAEGINPPDAAPALVDPPEAAPKEKKTRAKKEKPAATDDHVTLLYDPKETGPIEHKQIANLTGSTPVGFVVYADCVVSGEHSFISFRDLVAEAEQTVNTAFNVADYRLVEYGRGAGALVAAVKTLLADLKGGNVLVDLSSPSQRVCFDALCLVATTVVRGVR